MNQFVAPLFNLYQLFYPHRCQGCASDILAADAVLCVKCLHELPYTRFANLPGNPIEKIFWGRIHLQAAHSEFYFSKSSLIQHLVHQLKYKHGVELGYWLGQLMGQSIQMATRFHSVNAIIPLPLYPDKLKIRGFNQAAIIAEGMSSVMQVPVIDLNLQRKRYTETQTKKQRNERWLNVADSFQVVNPEELKGKHLLLVDDVVTTGATLEASGSVLLQVNGVQLSIATLMYAIKR